VTIVSELFIVVLIAGAFVIGRLWQWVRDAKAAMGTRPYSTRWPR